MCIRIYTLILYYFTNNLTNYNNLHRLQEIILNHYRIYLRKFQLTKNSKKYSKIYSNYSYFHSSFRSIDDKKQIIQKTRVIPFELFPIIKLTK